jgi:PBP1b-binding outer membrane lipoprotein LpoB
MGDVKMKSSKTILISAILLLALVQTGCSLSEQPAQAQSKQVGESQQHNHQTDGHHQHDHMANMDRNHADTTNPIQVELTGLTIIENEVNTGDFQKAEVTFDQMHSAYHSAVLPQIKDKNKTLADDMHSKFDALEVAIASKNETNIIKMINANRESLH